MIEMRNAPANDPVLPTRLSLLSRLKSWDEQDSWREFFETYWRLIFDSAIKAGLDEASAQDVVQETVIAVAKQMPGFRYDRTRGSFKGWLLQITRCRIADSLRRRYRQGDTAAVAPDSPAVEAELSGLSAAQCEDLEALWEAEWTTHVRTAALERVKRKSKPEQFQMFDLYVLRGWPVAKVAEALGVSRMQIYLARHRLGALLQRELKEVERRLG